MTSFWLITLAAAAGAIAAQLFNQYGAIIFISGFALGIVLNIAIHKFNTEQAAEAQQGGE